MAAQSIEKLVEIQGRRWAASQPHGAKRHRPCVAITRLPFAGGTELGERVARRLDYGFFDREIVDQIAREENVKRELVAGLDERVENAIEKYVVAGFRQKPFRESDYLQAITRVVATIAHRGAAVLVGRGAVFLVPPEQVLRVLVFAPPEWRRKRMAGILGISEEEAAERLGVLDAQRADFYRRTFDVEQTEATHYDLALNTGSIGLDRGASIVVDALHGRFHEA